MLWKTTTIPSTTIEDVQYTLFSQAMSDKQKKFNKLKQIIISDTVLQTAWKKVKKNKNSLGVDKQTVKDIEKNGVEPFLQDIKKNLEKNKYIPSRIKRIYISKPNGDLRPISILTVKDKVVQSALKLILEPIFEADFENCSYGYRPQRSTKHASLEVYKWLELGYDFVFQTDISHCFDSIPHDKLMDNIKIRIKDRFVLALIESWLTAGIIEKDHLTYPEKGIPQGSVISPLLCNIYLNQFDKQWSDNRFKEKPISDCHLIRYADDIIILSKKQIPLEYIENKLKIMSLEMKTEKTRIVKCSYGFEFLGYYFKKKLYSEHNRIGMYPNFKSIGNIKEKIEKKTDIKLVPTCSVEKMQQNVHSIVTGWLNYYLHTFYWKALQEIESFSSRQMNNYVHVYSYIHNHQH